MSSTWDEAMATGVPELDADHRRIAAIFDEILLSLAEGREHEAIVAVVSRLVEAMCEHIERENDLMRSLSFQCEAHRMDHDGYFGRLSQLMVDCQKHNRCIADKVRELIGFWKFQHLDGFDRQLAQALLDSREAPPAFRPEFSHPSACR